MSKRNMFGVLMLLGILVNIGVWLTGSYDLEARVGSLVLGRYIGINDEETWSTLLGWCITAGAGALMLIILYRNRI